MTKRGQLALVSGVALAMGVGGFLMTSKKPDKDKPEMTPRESVMVMEFPVGLSMTVGDADKGGSICHEYYKRSSKGSPDIKLKSHRIEKDFKNATEEQKRAWIIEDTLADIEETPLACTAPEEDWFLGSAYATDPPMCEECGGGCLTWSCPAVFNASFGTCMSNGGNCVISYTCCFHCPPPTCT